MAYWGTMRKILVFAMGAMLVGCSEKEAPPKPARPMMKRRRRPYASARAPERMSSALRLSR